MWTVPNSTVNSPDDDFDRSGDSSPVVYRRSAVLGGRTADSPAQKRGFLYTKLGHVGSPVSEEPDPDDLFALLDDEYARAILTATSKRPMSAKTLSEEIDASLPTIYRRIERLRDSGLIEERPAFQREGRHYGVFEARLERIDVKLDDGELIVSVEIEPTDPADRFTAMWEDL